MISLARTIHGRCIHGAGCGSSGCQSKRCRSDELAAGILHSILHLDHDIELFRWNEWTVDGKLQLSSAGHEFAASLCVRDSGDGGTGFHDNRASLGFRRR